MTDPGQETQSEGVQAAHADPATKNAAPSVAAAPARALDAKTRERMFGEIYARHFDYVWHTLRRFGVWDRDLEDAAHELFIVVHRRLDDYDESRPLKPWLVGIAFRIASDFRRRAQHRREIVGEDVEAVDGNKSAADVVAEREAKALVARALETLDDDKRLVFVLHELEGRPIPEVAELIQAPLNTCYSRLRLARERFTAAVRALRADPDGEQR